jgi:hypothetical protein
MDKVLEDLRARVEKLEAEVKKLKPVLGQTRRGAKLTAAQRKAIRIEVAARARAAKRVGKGKGAVRSKAVQQRLKNEAE